MKEGFDNSDRQRYSTGAIAAALFVILTGIYSLTYSGIFKSGDEYWYVGGALSLGGWGDLSGTPTGFKVLEQGFGEPLQAFPGAVLYQLARITQVGTVQTLFLTNVYVTALTGVVVFLIVRQRGGRPGTAVGAALLFGLGTLAWPHSKLYFRDPLAMFFVALALLSLERTCVRVTGRGRAAQWVLTLCLLGGGILTKNTAVFALPAFLMSASVRPGVKPAERRILLAGLVIVAVAGFIALFAWNGLFGAIEPRRPPMCADPLSKCVIGDSFVPAIIGTLASPGKGLFTESPALLLALAALALPNKRERFNNLTAWLTLLGLAVGLAYYEDYLWYGGTGWGIRHFLPVAPMLAAACAPTLQAIAASRRRWVKLAGGGLILWSVFIQIGAVLLLPEAYYSWLSKMEPGAPWTLALWHPAYTEAAGYWRLLLSGGAVDLAWLRTFSSNAKAIIGLIATWLAVIMAALFVLRRALAGIRCRNVTRASMALAALAGTVMPYGLLRAYYPDPYYFAARSDYHEAADFVTQAAQPGDAIVVRGLSTEIWKFFINYVYFPVRWYTYTPFTPNKNSYTSVLDEPGLAHALLPKTEKLFSEILPRQHARFWQVSDQCSGWAFLRLEERWLAQRYFAATSRPFQGECTTLVSSFAIAAPPVVQGKSVDFRFGEALRLTAATQLSFAERTTLKPGDILPVRLDWQLTQPVPIDYSIGVYLLDASGVLQAQHDGWARGGFFAMTRWPLDATISDQHGLDLPEQLPPGEYQVGVAVYDWQTVERLPVSEANGPVPDNLARVLTVTINAP